MKQKDIISLSNLRLDTARERLETSKNLLESDFKTSLNRSYYAVHAAMRAVLALDLFDSKKHMGVISEFRKRYVKTGIFNKRFSEVIERLFHIRTDCDYEDFYIATKEEAISQYEAALDFVNAVEEYLKSVVKNSS